MRENANKTRKGILVLTLAAVFGAIVGIGVAIVCNEILNED